MAGYFFSKDRSEVKSRCASLAPSAGVRRRQERVGAADYFGLRNFMARRRLLLHRHSTPLITLYITNTGNTS
jgi:hypothetical protein